MTAHVVEKPVFMETPASAVARVGREAVIVDRQTIWIERPTDSDRLLDDPAVLAANVKDDYMPYWADIWPAARMMAKAILREPPERFQRRDDKPMIALELGCGLGLAGVAALKRGLNVIFSDYDLTALRFAERNAKLNGHSDFQMLPLDWRFPPDGLQVPFIIAADLTYELRNIDPLIALIKKMLLPDGTCLLTDPDRAPATTLRRRLEEEGLFFTMQFIRAGEPGGNRSKGTLYRIAKSITIVKSID
jgi:predicted nicotinamide N-methyase